jgi:ribosome-interacting GTPase 1
MPANLTPQYLAADKRFKEASTTQEKIEALEEMMATIPKHKGTEKMRADLRRRMAKLHSESSKKHGSSKASAMYSVHREGAGQVVLVGAPNTGKSALLARLTHATPEIGDYPFTTRLPQPGMMPFENIQIQIVDMPPIASEFYESWMGSIVRAADMALIVVDASADEALDEADSALKLLEGSNIRLVRDEPEETEDAAQLTAVFRRALLAANKVDAEGSAEILPILREFYQSQFDIFAVSAVSGEGIEELRRAIFKKLDVVRIFTKAPGKKADLASIPFVLKGGSTVVDAARAIHRDLAHTFKFARVWSSEKSHRSVKFDGQMVERTYRLEDGDILELHE